MEYSESRDKDRGGEDVYEATKYLFVYENRRRSLVVAYVCYEMCVRNVYVTKCMLRNVWPM